MPADSKQCWTDNRVQATVTPAYILKQFRPEIHELLKLSTSFGQGVTDHTYLGWILERAQRLFLILGQIGVPEQIFGLVDESYSDHNLPIAAHAVKNLKLSAKPNAALDDKFYRAQFKYLVRDIREGDHIRFLDEETIPIKVVGPASGMNRSSKDVIEKVCLTSDATRIYGRKRIVLDEPPNRFTEADILSEITAAKQLAHQHVLSVRGSYMDGNSIFVLLMPAIDYSLSSFLNSPPKNFESLPKPRRREILLNWPHCLANGLAWLHDKGRPHGALRPSNVVVDREYQIYLGEIDGLYVMHGNVKVSDIESYHYAAPERWKRAATMQTKAPAMMTHHSGGRTSRKTSSKGADPSSVDDFYPGWTSAATGTSPGVPIDMSKPTSTAYPFIPTSKRHVSRPNGRSIDGVDYAASVLSSNSSGMGQDRPHSGRSPPQPSGHRSSNRTGGSASAARSTISSQDSDSGQNAGNTLPSSIMVAPSEIRTAVVQTWQSAQYDPFAADVFSLGAIILEIITFLCKRSPSAFARHRSSKNRTAGRGGGVADASFHANLGQVYSWTVSMEQDAKKKASREEGEIFMAVGPMMEVALECLARSAEDRPDAGTVEKSLEDCIQQTTNSGRTHCTLRAPPPARHAETPGKSPPDVRPPPNEPTSTTRFGDKEIERGAVPFPQTLPLQSAKGKSAPIAVGKPGPAGSSLAKSAFDRRGQGTDHPTKGDGTVDEDWHPHDGMIELQSIADRPHRIQNGSAVSSWSQAHSDPRASYVSSDTQATSVLEAEFADSFFVSDLQPPSLPPKEIHHAHSYQALSPPSLSRSHVSNSGRKRVTPDAGRQGQKSSTTGTVSQQEGADRFDVVVEHFQSRFSADTDSQRRSDTSTTDTSRGRQSDTSITDTSRHSVSTLASNTSTLRLSWQQRDVSPVSAGGRDTPTNASCAPISAGSQDPEAAGQDVIHARAQPSELEGQSKDPRRRGDLSGVERLSRKSSRGNVLAAAPSGESKNKGKQDSASWSRAAIHRRFSLLGGKT
jgi:Protein tyrosine and serine/threonine kinase